MNAPVMFIPDLIAPAAAASMFKRLVAELDWERRDTAPRSEYYCNDTPAPYTYGRGAGIRTYEPKPWHPLITDVRTALEAALDGVVLDVCFLNMYNDSRDWLGWHSDDSPEMDPNRPIVSVSFGAARAIEFRPVGTKSATDSLMLTPGSAAVMLPGTQATWEHRIPKVGYNVGPRISLTFRGFVGN